MDLKASGLPGYVVIDTDLYFYWFDTLVEVVSNLEAQDVEANEYRVFDLAGLEYRLDTVTGKVALQRGDQADPARMVALLRDALLARKIEVPLLEDQPAEFARECLRRFDHAMTQREWRSRMRLRR